MSGRLPADAFHYYASLGPARSYQLVAQHYGVTKRAVTKRAADEAWQNKLEKLENEARSRAEEKALESLEAMNSRHLKSMRAVQARALQALQSMPLATAMEAVRALDLAVRHERLIRGEPSDRTAVSVEDTIRREYERWMGKDGASE